MAFFFLAAIVFVLDQVTKALVLNRMDFSQSIPVIKNIFHITLVRNYGAAFGILQNYRGLLIAIASVAVVLIFLYLRQVPPQFFFLRLGLSLQIAGALGNLIDRVRFGYVVDFLDFRFWPVFNVADMAIVVGIFFLAFDFIRMAKKGM